jgi:lipid-binding SYLF domain-containing protein
MLSRLHRTLAIVAVLVFAAPALAQEEQQALVDKARISLNALRNDPDHPNLKATLARAKAVLIIPSLLKAGFLIGGEGGSGVLLVRNANGEWSPPAFYTLASGSIGLQIGAQDAEVLFTVMTDKGLRQVLKNEFKMGADASVALGPIGGGVEASTTLNMGADIYAFSKTRGAFAGGSFEGSYIKPRAEWNKLYYGQAVGVEDIVLNGKASNPGADTLRQTLAAR